ncbi:MAG: serine hydrolase domain-containing protein [Pyrinomonadaceae bacterium]
MQASLTTRDTQISAMLAKRIAAGDFPSAVYLISEEKKSVFADALGHAVIDPYRITASLNTIYDLASLTKPLVTGMLCAQLVEKGDLTLDSSVAHYLPEFERTDRQLITVRELLTHTSGLPAWRPLYVLAENNRERALGVIANEALEYKTGTRVVYSDLGFIVLGFLLERLTGTQLGELARTEIIEPLKLQDTFFNPEMALQTGIAACETGNAYERQTALVSGGEHYSSWREQVIWGEVHDGNSYFLGGVAGHAGLFSTAKETLRLATQFLAHQSELLNADTCTELFTRNMTKGLEEARSISWQLAQSPESAAGLSLPPDSFGHSGFTGTSCWIDPHHQRVFILLTNRTHARSLPFVNINSVRREFHSMSAAALAFRG